MVGQGEPRSGPNDIHGSEAIEGPAALGVFERRLALANGSVVVLLGGPKAVVTGASAAEASGLNAELRGAALSFGVLRATLWPFRDAAKHLNDLRKPGPATSGGRVFIVRSHS